MGFYSRKLTAPEQNYEIHDKELLSIIEAFKEWRYLLIGTEIPVHIYTDHKNLIYFKENRALNRRQARWSLFLSDFNFTINYRAGSKQVVSDALSRQASFELTKVDKDTNLQVLLPSERFISTLGTNFMNLESTELDSAWNGADYISCLYQSHENNLIAYLDDDSSYSRSHVSLITPYENSESSEDPSQ